MRERNPNQGTEFSFSRFLVPHLMGVQHELASGIRKGNGKRRMV